MKRDASLAKLSRDHHKALRIAQKLCRATDETTEQLQAELSSFWETHGHKHFRLEEEILLPAFAAHGDAYHRLVAAALCDHVAIRHRVHVLVSGPVWTPSALHVLGVQLRAHVQMEERELFR